MNHFKSFYPTFLMAFLCFSGIAQSNCNITDVQAEVQSCDSSDMFFVHIDFNIDNPGSQGFIISGNGVTYDTFNYGAPFYEVGPLNGDCTTFYEFLVTDIDSSDCQGVVELDEVVCCPKLCSITATQTDLDTCVNGFRRVFFEVDAENQGSLGFDLMFEGIVLQHYDYGQSVYFYDFPGIQNIFGITVADTEFPDCFSRIDNFDWIPCPDAPVCSTLPTPDREFQCTSDTTYNAIINFEYPGTDDSLYISFFLYPNTGQPILLFTELIPVKAFPYIIPDLPISNDLYVVFIHEQDNPFCYTGNEWNDPPDCSGFFACEISNVIAEQYACNDTSDLIMVDIAFDVDNPVSDSFEIRGNGVVYGTFAYGESFYTVGPISANCEDNYEFIVIDSEDPDCFGATEFEEPPCCACEIFDIVVDPGNCTGDGTYELYVDFEYQNVASDQFDVYSAGAFIGSYNLNDLPITIENFPERDAAFDVIQICPSDNPDCCLTYEFMGTDCTELPCEIFDVFAEVSECDEDGFVTIDVEFDFDNTSSDEFFIIINDEEYGPFMYGQIFYTVGPFQPDCELDYTVTITDAANPDCSDSFTFPEALCCEDGPCEIYNLVVDPLECTGDGIYSAFLGFQVDFPTNNFFDVYSQGNLLGTFSLNNLPVLVTNVPEREVEFDILTVCINDNPDCCQTIEFMGLDCTEEEEPCSITNLSVDPIQCTGNGTYSVWVEFDFENVTDDMFDVYSGDVLIGSYPFSQVPLIIEEFPERDAEEDRIVICVNENEMCCAELEFTGLDCEIVCSISDVVVDPLECTDEGTYSIVLDFEYEGTTNDFFEVWSGSTYLGFFPFDALPVTIFNFPDGEGEFDAITICENDTDDCCTSYEFMGLDCTEDPVCFISNVSVDLDECTGVGTYSLFLNFDYENVTSSQFDVFSDGVPVGTYNYADLPVFIEAFPERDAEFDFMVICDNDNPSCCSGFEFLGLNCEEEESCVINEVFAEASECNDDGFYFVDIEFNVENPMSNGFVVRGNGIIYDTFEYGQLFYTIGPLEGNCDLIREFVVIDLEDEDCQGAFAFDEPICCEDEEVCSITEVFAEASECNDDGFYFVDIQFNVNNPTSNGFVVRGNGIIYDTFEYGELFYTIGPLEGDCDLIREFIVIDLENEDCQGAFGFDEPVCCEDEPACFIGGVFGELYECEEGSSEVLVDIVFEYENVGESGFTIRGNGIVYDTFEYGADFYTVGPIEADCETTYEFIITDLENPDCTSFFFFADPPCCEDEACAVEGIIGEADCVDDVYIIEYNLEYQGTEGLGFDVYINDFFHSFHSYEDLPIVLEVDKNEFPSPFEITACENDNPDCCSTTIFEFIEVSVNELLPEDAIKVIQRDQQLLLETALDESMHAHLIALDGRRLSSEVFSYNATINLDNYPSGMYILFIESELGIYTEKIAFIR